MCQFRNIHSFGLLRETSVYGYQQYFPLLSGGNSTTRMLGSDKIRAHMSSNRKPVRLSALADRKQVLYLFPLCILFLSACSRELTLSSLLCTCIAPVTRSLHLTQSGCVNNLIAHFQETNRISPLHIKVGTINCCNTTMF